MSIMESLPLLEPPARPPGVELVPGTTLPIHVGPGGEQVEGRGNVELRPERLAPGLVDKLQNVDGLEPHERMMLELALRNFDRREPYRRTIYAQVAGETDATTGNLVVPLFTVPAGFEGHIANVTADVPDSATINGSAPLANAAIFTFLSIAAAGSFTNANADLARLRRGVVAFGPTSAGGPSLPFTWTFNDSGAPVAFGGEVVYYVLRGGNIAAALSQSVQVSYRINLKSHT